MSAILHQALLSGYEAAGGGGPNVVLLLPMDGTNGSTTFTDSSPSPKTVTANGNAQISTAQSVFGGASAFFDGSGDFLTVSGKTVFNMSEDFTIEFWVMPETFAVVDETGSNRAVLSFASTALADATPAIFFGATGFSNPGQIWFFGSASILVGSVTFSVNAWRYVALVRSGSTLTWYIDGVASGSTTFTTTIAPEQILIGRSLNTAGDFQGFIDDLRITVGVARYTANFTPPTAPFPDE
jgi:hypothetical protein